MYALHRYRCVKNNYEHMFIKSHELIITGTDIYQSANCLKTAAPKKIHAR